LTIIRELSGVIHVALGKKVGREDTNALCVMLSAITNMATARNFEVISNKFNLANICAYRNICLDL